MVDSLDLKEALQRMWRVRFCPPDDVGLREEHRIICPFCEYEVMEEKAFYINRGTDQVDYPIEPGDFRLLSRDLEGWDEKGLYHNAPLVFVIESNDTFCRVALVHPEEDLKVAEDVTAGPGLFVEAWNSFAVPTKYIGKCIARAPHLVPSAKNAKLPNDFPTIVHEYFCKMEVEVAAYFAVKVLGELMEPYSDVLDEISYMEENELNVAFSTPCILPEGDKGILEKIALSEVSNEPLAMAAADQEDIIPVRIAKLEGKRVFLYSVPAIITFRSDEPESLTIGGRVPEKLSPDAGIFSAWIDPNTKNTIGYPSEAFLDPVSGFFRIKFDSLSKKDVKTGQPVILVGTR
jgi:hypothetical protein